MAESSSEKAPVTRRRPRPSAKRKAVLEQKQEEMAKRRRTFDDFFNFCNFVLAYEEKLKAAERLPTSNHTDTNSAGESTPSSSSSSSSSGGNSTTSSEDSGDELTGSGGEEGCATPPPEDPPSQFEPNNDKLEYTSDDESWNLVTCFCRRPFAGRPMIECHKCQTWVHLFCAKIKKDQVPDIYTCPKCRPSQGKNTAGKNTAGKSTVGKQKGGKTNDPNSS